MTRVKKPRSEYSSYYDLIFRGYGEDDKIKRVNNAPLKSFEEVASSRDLFGVFKECVVMIDIDDPQSAELLLNILNDNQVSYLYQMTTRGCHVFFSHGRYTKQLKDKTHVMLACGIYADIKCRCVDGTKLVKDSEPRPIQASEYYVEDNDLVELPHYLVPVGAEREFLEMKEGDSRNSSLYEYILVLLRYGLKKEEVKSTIAIINDYLLADPFSKRQLDVILRDDAFPTNNEIYIYKQPGSKTPSLDYELFAKRMIEVFKISKINDLMYIYEEQVYMKLTDEVMEFRIMDVLKNTKSQMRKECKTYLRKYAESKLAESANKILFQNGIYDIDNKTLLTYTEGVFFNQIAVDYSDDVQPQETVDKFLNDISVGDKDVRKLLLQMIGYSLMRSNPYQVFFFLDGNGKNGKSVLFDFIEYCVDKKNISHLSIHNLTDKYGVGLLRDKLINMGDDVPQDYIGDTSIIKKAVSGETILVEEKFKDKETLNFQGTLIFSGNGIPKFGDKTDGLMRRIVTIPMKAKFVDKVNRDLKIKERLFTPINAQYLIKLAIDALQELLTEGAFCECKAAEDAKHDFEINNNNVYEYYTEHENTIDGRSTSTIYLAYQVWCQENGYKDIYAKNKFTNFMKQYGFTTKQIRVTKSDKRERVFMKIEEVTQLPLDTLSHESGVTV